MRVVIGVDPHKGSHTAVAIDANEQQLAKIQVRSGPRQLEQLLAWAAEFGERVWAVESAGGLGYLLAQQLIGAGERVLDVPATLASRVRVLATTKSQRLTVTTRCRSRSPHAHPTCNRWNGQITRSCSVCSRSGTGIWAGPGTAARVGFMRCCSSSSRAVFPRKSR